MLERKNEEERSTTKCTGYRTYQHHFKLFCQNYLSLNRMSIVSIGVVKGDIQCTILQLKKNPQFIFNSASFVGRSVHPGQFESEQDKMRTHHCKERISMARSTSPPVERERASPSSFIITIATKCPLPTPSPFPHVVSHEPRSQT